MTTRTAKIRRTIQIVSILLFMKSKEMPKTRKVSRKNRRRTLRRKAKKGGYEGQQLAIPSSAFKNAAPVNSDNAWYKIA